MDEKADLITATADAVATGGFATVALAALRLLGVRTSAQSMDEAVQADWVAWVSEAVIDFERHHEKWSQRGEAHLPTATDLAAVLSEAQRVYTRTADAKKRRALREAVVNAFDPEQYESGLSLRLIRIIDLIEYGDIRVLADVDAKRLSANLNDWPREQGQFFGETLSAHHVKQLILVDLAWTSISPDSPQWAKGNGAIRLTDLGRRLLRLIALPSV